MPHVHVAGIDIGSTYTKAIALNGNREVVGTAVRRTGFKLAQAAEGVFEELLKASRLERSVIAYVAATGYGRYTAPFRHTQITELTAHAQAAVHLFPETRTLLDIGGQDIKALKIDAQGRVKAFRLNDKCAAGTGAFLEKTARYLGLTTDDIGPYAIRSTKPVEVSSVCAVFAESEVINHLANGIPAEDIMMGAMVALGGRAVQLMRRVGLEPGYMLAGGMTRNAAMVNALEDNLKSKLKVAPDGLGQLNGALGAALLGLRRVEKLIAEGRPIPPTAAQQGQTDTAARRRWSAQAVKKRVEPCTVTGSCPVVIKVLPQAVAAA
ncbi:MAG: 2-hydroxyglutaryl-CoA dehydratase [Betaproteobacteria bacterium]|nr:2-hydroxyglutaryl-CoA dehydratase [Betaproteobacteria bacterium]MBI2961578.1 2-hydroxyglutaryl-CoA dehydratase [Betaproteobacteria bacterium]